MNDLRRKEIEAVLNDLADLHAWVEAIQQEEKEAFDYMPEGLQQTPNGQVSEAAASALDDALGAFDEIASSPDEVKA